MPNSSFSRSHVPRRFKNAELGTEKAIGETRGSRDYRGRGRPGLVSVWVQRETPEAADRSRPEQERGVR